MVHSDGSTTIQTNTYTSLVRNTGYNNAFLKKLIDVIFVIETVAKNERVNVLKNDKIQNSDDSTTCDNVHKRFIFVVPKDDYTSWLSVSDSIKKCNSLGSVPKINS